jgi:hypothetical protein
MYGSRFSWLRYELEEGVQLHNPAALHPGKVPSYSLTRRLGWPQNRIGLSGEEKILELRESNSDVSVIQRVGSRYADCANVALC